MSVVVSLAVILVVIVSLTVRANAATVTFDVSGTEDSAGMDSLKLLFLFALLALAPSILIMMTSFTRIVIVFSFMRSALGLQSTPPNQVIVGIALFLSLFIMAPVGTEINDTALVPYSEGTITAEEALDAAQDPLKEFMLKQTKTSDLNLFLSLSGQQADLTSIDPEQLMDLGMEIIVPAFITSELSRAFMIGFFLYLPFLVIDMIVSSTLMSIGMVMLPPSMISLPFKLMLFIVVDGWRLLMEMLIKSFY